MVSAGLVCVFVALRPVQEVGAVDDPVDVKKQNSVRSRHALVYTPIMHLHTSEGVLEASFEKGIHRLYLVMDPEIARLCRALLPPAVSHQAKVPKYPPHVTVVREEAPDMGMKLLDYIGEKVKVEYDPQPIIGEKYVWCPIWSPRLHLIRLRLGLSFDSWYTRPPEDWPLLHMTVANFKE